MPSDHYHVDETHEYLMVDVDLLAPRVVQGHGTIVLIACLGEPVQLA